MIYISVKKVVLLFLTLIVSIELMGQQFDDVFNQADRFALLESFIVGDIPQGIKDIVLFPQMHHNLLLYGPEGTGKTTIVKALAYIKNAELLQISGGSIVSESWTIAKSCIPTLLSFALKLV